MLRLLTILIASMLIGNGAAAFTKSTCNVFEDYVYNQNVLIKAVDKEIIKAGKQPKWFQGNLDCKNVQIEKTGPKSANLRVLVNVNCYGYMPVTEYVCYDSNNKAVGNEQFLIDFSATCYKENNQSDSCLKVTGIKRMTKPTPTPAPVPQNKWIPINYDFIPKDVRDAAVKYVREVTTLNKYKPGPADSYLYTGNAFRKESAAGTAYRIKGAAVTGRLIKNCPYPFMTQDLDVAIAKAKTGGALTKLPKDIILRKITIVTGSDDEDWTGKCDKTPEAKRALEQAKAFIAANSPKKKSFSAVKVKLTYLGELESKVEGPANMAQTRVLIAKDLENSKKCTPKFLDIPDLTSGAPCPYLVAGKTIQECSVYQPKFASWFINDAIQQDGSLYIGTPVDVLFLILPALESTRSSGGNFCELEHCLEALCLTPAASEALTALITPEQMQCICDTKHVGGHQYYRLSDDRLLAWLSVKVEQTKAALVDQAAGFAGMDAMGLTVYAAGILGEYLSPEWSTKLSKYLSLPQPGDGAGGSNATGAAAPPPLYNPDVAFDRATESKRPRFDPKEAAKAKAQAARAEAKAAKIAKEAAGMRKLSSFFSKKS